MSFDNEEDFDGEMEWSLEGFTLQPLLWHFIEGMVAEPEWPDVKVVIGEGLIDENNELHEEACSLLEIWQDYRDETDKEQKSIALNAHLNKLPEPPMMRDNLKKEIKMFVDLLQQKANSDGRKVSNVLNERDSSIVDYVMEDKVSSPIQRPPSRPSSSTSRSSASSSRPSTAWSSNDGRQTPLRATPKSDISSCTSSMSDHLESMNENLNAMEIDRIAEHLRELLVQERSRLKDDIVFLQDCLFEESDYRQQVLTSPEPEPSLKDLRDLGTKLEKELLHSSKPIVNNNSTRAKSLAVKQKSLDEERAKPKTYSPQKPIVPKPPTSPPERQHKTTKTARTYHKPVNNPTMPQSPPGTAKLIPSPPSSAKTQRPGSAARFRRLVLDCRESTN